MSALDQEQRADYLVLDAGLAINTADPTNEHWTIYETVLTLARRGPFTALCACS